MGQMENAEFTNGSIWWPWGQHDPCEKVVGKKNVATSYQEDADDDDINYIYQFLSLSLSIIL